VAAHSAVAFGVQSLVTRAAKHLEIRQIVIVFAEVSVMRVARRIA